MSEQPLGSKNVMGGPGLTAGGNASIGDVTGQVAIGEYITQFMIKEPSGEALVKLIAYLEQKRKEEANLKMLNSYNPSALPYFDPGVKEFVTTNRVEELNQALVYLQDHRLLIFTGIGGVGKTTLLRALIDIRPANVPIPFWFDFRLNQSARLEDILEKLAAYMNSPDIVLFKEEKREPEKKDIDRLTDKLQVRKPVWLIFDNLETIFDDIYFKDENVDLFFTCLRNSTHQAKIIITSRIFPKLKNGECLIDVIEGEKQGIRGLKTNFAVDYLVKNGLGDLKPDKLEELATGVDGHPLALNLLVGLVKEYGVEDILEDLSLYQEQKKEIILIARKLFKKLVGDEKGLLERISIYREPVRMKGLKNMFAGMNSPNAIKKLIDKSLLETDHNGNYWLHPLVQEFSYSDLENKEEVHKFAMEYYLSLPIPEKLAKKEDIQPLIEAHYHACMSEEHDQAFNIIFDNNLHIYLDLWGNYTVLVDLYSKLLPEYHFGEEILLKDKGNHSIILGNLGIAYKDLSEPRKAIEYSEKGLKIAQEIGNRRGESIVLGNLGIAYHYLGELKKAIEYSEKGLKIAQEIGYRQGEGNHLGNLGIAYKDLGDPIKAIEYYEQALKIAQEIGDRRGEEACLGNLGIAYKDLSEPRKAIEYFEKGLKIAQEIGYRQGEGSHLGNLGIAYKDLGDPIKAIEYYERALEIAQEIGDKRAEGNLLGNLGIVYSDVGDPIKAIEYYERALKIAQEIGDRRRKGNHLGNLGIAYKDLGDPIKAIEYYEQALKIAQEIGDRQGEEACLGNLGIMYRDLGDPIKAIEYYEQALKIAKETGDRRGEGIALWNLGMAYSDLDEPRRAIEYYGQGLFIGREIEDQKIIDFCERSLEELKDS